MAKATFSWSGYVEGQPSLCIQVVEGGMWKGAGGNSSGRVGKWEVSELTRDRVLRELLAIAQRAAG